MRLMVVNLETKKYAKSRMAPHGIVQPAVSITHGRRTVNGSRSGLSETSTILIRISAWLVRKAGRSPT